MRPNHVDVVIIGAGLAGLTLARQLMMQKPLTVLHLEKREHVPVTRQKVGESNVQVQGWYLGKVLDLEEYLFHEHLMKYNLRFLWPTGAGDDFTDYGQSYIRNFSNIPCYQLDRNKFEGKLIELNRENEGYNLVTGVRKLQVDLKEDAAPHELTWKVGDAAQSVTADWVIDSTGRSRVLARDMDMRVNAPFRHSAAYFWVDGTVNIEKLTRAGRAELLRHPSRRELGHLPFWLATNHFMGEGYWFWVIPLQGRTSFGLVFDNHLIDPASVNRPEKLLSWLKEHIPLFQFDRQDLIDFSFLANFAHGCDRTIHRNRWAMTGESGRFTDPLYSPGGDLIAIHNTLITDAVLTDDPAQLMGKIGRYETMFKVFYHSFIPSYDPGYLSLGDQEIFAMKYSWELAIYFGYFVFPFINDLYTDRNFLIPFFRRLAALGNVNRRVHKALTDYTRWKKEHAARAGVPVFFDFTRFDALRRAEKTFYQTGLEPKEAVRVLDEQQEHLRETARFIIAHTEAVMTGEPDRLIDAGYIEGIDLDDAAASTPARFTPCGRTYDWSIDTSILKTHFGQSVQTQPV